LAKAGTAQSYLAPFGKLPSYGVKAPIDPFRGENCMRTGTVKWFNTRKGYGFIKPVDGGFDVHVDISALKRAGLINLKEGQKINFETVANERTRELFAENLSLLPNAPTASPTLRSAGRKASWLGPFRGP
jgi:cold shock protein